MSTPEGQGEQQAAALEVHGLVDVGGPAGQHDGGPVVERPALDQHRLTAELAGRRHLAAAQHLLPLGVRQRERGPPGLALGRDHADRDAAPGDDRAHHAAGLTLGEPLGERQPREQVGVAGQRLPRRALRGRADQRRGEHGGDQQGQHGHADGGRRQPAAHPPPVHRGTRYPTPRTVSIGHASPSFARSWATWTSTVRLPA